jgi:hypothetical protein
VGKSIQNGPPTLLWSFGVTKEGKMMRILNWVFNWVFELLLRLSGEDADEDSNWASSSSETAARRPICGNEASEPSPPEGN